MTPIRRLLTTALACLSLSAGLLVAAAVPAQAARPRVDLNSVGDKYVGAAIPIIGNLGHSGWRHDKTLYLQRRLDGQWRAAGRLTHRTDGRFRFPDRHVYTAQVARWRVVVRRSGHLLDVSNTLAVRVLRKPVITPPPPSTNQGLPDLVVLDLNSCSDAEDTNPDPLVDNCFRIVQDGARKLLKFPTVTANRGPGDLRIMATRSSSTSTDWQAQQYVVDQNGDTSSNFIPAMEFFFAGDGHSHWHIRDFDAFQLLDANGVVATGDKHGFCLEDNRNLPGVTTDPVFTHDVVCGVGNPSATTIVHGLSAGWGDTYPSSLPDQAIDVTGLPDGVYTVRVVADQAGLVRETDNANNSAVQRVSIVGDTVTPVS